MLAHAQGTLLNQSKLASSLGVSSPTVGRYLDLLVDLLLVRQLRPIRDSGITHALLGIEAFDDLLGHPVAGSSREGFAIENLIAVAQGRRTPHFRRTEDGAEVDFPF
jgi:predicted AAA+ superfamily ATPase